MRRRPNWQGIKRHRSYSVGEAAKVLGVSKLTVRRWIKDGGLPALKEKRPTLILGRDLKEFHRLRSKPRTRLQSDELFCFKCRCARTPAANMADYTPRTSRTGTLMAICEVCGTDMHKAISAAALGGLARVLDLSFPEGQPHLSEIAKPLVHDHFRQEPMR